MQINNSEAFMKQGDMITKAPENENSIINLTNVIMVVAFLLLVCIVFYYNSKDINLKIAYGGYGPQDYVAQKLHPENFIKNWPNGILNYDYSLPMRAYYYLAKYFGISPSVTVYPFMFIQTFFYLLSIAFLTQTLFRNKIVTFISVVVMSVSNLAGLNLATFGDGYSHYLGACTHYTFSNTFRIFALGFFLRNRYIISFILLALSIYCHVNMGLFAGAFIGIYLLFNPRLFLNKSIQIGIVLFLVLIAPHIYSMISDASISSGGIPVDQWVKSTRIFSCHWYPITMKLFTSNAHREFFPFLLLCFFFFVSLKYQDIKDDKNLKIIVGCIACLIMSILGVFFSDVYPIPFLIRISLQRSTGLITFFGVLYIVYYTIRKMDSGNIVTVFMAVLSLLVLIFAKPGIAVLPLFLLLFADIKEGWFGPIKIRPDKIRIAKIFYYIAALSLLLLTLICTFQDKFKITHIVFLHLWSPLQYFNPFIGYDFLIHGGSFKINPLFKSLVVCAALCAGIVIILRLIGKRLLNIVCIGIFAVISLLGIWYLERDHYSRWNYRYGKVAESYLDVQLWAKKNTPPDVLFMPDPSHSYGWRDFSERSSFGNLREWGYCAIAYSSEYPLYEEGLERMQEFGIDIEKITITDLKKTHNIYGAQLSKEIKSRYYNMSPDEILELCKRYGIDYFIMNKKWVESQDWAMLNKFEIVYSNDHFMVIEPR